MSLATIVALTSEPYNPVKPLEKTANTEPRTALNIWSAWFPVSYYLETTQKDWQVGQWKHDYSTLGDHRSIYVEHWDTGRTFPSIALLSVLYFVRNDTTLAALTTWRCLCVPVLRQCAA